MVHYNLLSSSFWLSLVHQCGAARPRGAMFQNLLKNDQERDVANEQRHVGPVTKPLSRWSRRKDHSNLELIAAEDVKRDISQDLMLGYFAGEALFGGSDRRKTDRTRQGSSNRAKTDRTRQKEKNFVGSSSESSSSSSGSSPAPHNADDLEQRGYNITKGVVFHHNGQAVADLLLFKEQHTAGTLKEMRDLIIKHIHCATEQRDDCEALVESSSSSSVSEGPVQRFENVEARYVERPVQRFENVEARYVERPVQRMENDFYRMEHRVEDGMMGTLPHNTGPWPRFGIFGCGNDCKKGASSFVQDDSATGINIGGGEGMFKRQLDGMGHLMQHLIHLAFKPVQQLVDYRKRQPVELERIGVGGGHSTMNERTTGLKKKTNVADGSSSLLQTVEGVTPHGLSEVSKKQNEEQMTAPENASRSPRDLVSPTNYALGGSFTFGIVCIILGSTVIGVIVIMYAMKKYSANPPQKCSAVDDGYTHEPSVEPDFEPEPDPEC